MAGTRSLQSNPGFPTPEPTYAPTDVFGNETNTDWVYVAIGGTVFVMLCAFAWYYFFYKPEIKEEPNPEVRRRPAELFHAEGSGTESNEGAPLLTGGRVDKLKSILAGNKNKGMNCKILRKNKKEEKNVDMIDALLSMDVKKKEISWVKNAMLFSGDKQVYNLDKLQMIQIGKFSELMKKLPVKEQLCLSLIFEGDQVLDIVFDDETTRNDVGFGFQELNEMIRRGDSL